ncbi:MAG: MFS transporter [Verrucomicrobia subdivision 3 bacterium]|nr:MFS transporter [Limisphaerales bacterium]
MSEQRLTLREKFGYGLGDMASNIVYQAVINVLMYFYTDVYGIEAAAAGTLMIAVRFFDAITDPIMGAVADRTRTRWGRYRPWMLWFAIPYGMLAVAAFITPNVAPGTKLVYAYISYALLMTAYTAVNIPYSALAGVMTADKDERSGLQSWRFGMAMVGGFLVTVSIWPLSRLLGGGGKPEDLQLGFPFAVALLAVVGVIALFGCFAWTRERVYPDEQTQKEAARRTNVFEDLGAMFRNSQWLIVTLAMFVIQIRGGLQGNVKPYFIRYYIAHDLTGIFAITENFMALYMGLTMLAGVAGVFVANRLFLKRSWCKVTVMKTALLGSLVPNALLLFVPRQWWEASLLLIMVANFFHMMFLPLLFAAIPDTVDFGLKTIGRGAMALFFAGQLFALKMGISVGGGSAGWILGMFGYRANVEQTERSLFGIKLAFAGAPLVAAVLVVILLQLYKLKKGWEHRESVVGPALEPQ